MSVTFAGANRPRVESVDAAALTRGDIRLLPPGSASARRLVSSGRTWLDGEVRIVHPETLYSLEEDEIGEIWVVGPHVAQGYWRRPAKTEAVFGAKIPGETGGPYLRTGDLGFLHRGELFITGRMKDLIVIRGQTHYPQDVELSAERSHPVLRGGYCVAFGVEHDGEEQVVVIQGAQPDHEGAWLAAEDAVRRAVAMEHGIALHAVILVPPSRIDRTTSGKVRRRVMRAKYLSGELA